ncbi:unnamed protein product [Oppiella nova]|uniref:Uncharacterized protein n=1 Tax=Oppiella nova TaxID=334625 RepID=A0A7R9QQT8_9ACAR|nr:unnamed protein product [Oppiella nova]CAG2172216.1 unnamed protein product [Oppiella nova]
MEFEDLLKGVGDFGKFQKLLVILLLIPASALNILYDYMFMLTTPDHWCYVPQLANLSKHVQTQLIRPLTIEQGLPSYDKCHMYDINYDLVNSTTVFPFNNSSDIKTRECDNGWVYDESVFGATATTQFNLVCNNAHYVSVLMSLGAIGLVITTPIFSAVTDCFSVCRFIGGSLLVIYYQIPFILAVEFVGTDYRSKTSSLSAIGYSLGGCILPGVVYLTSDWVWLAVFQFVATLPFLLCWRLVPESASWLITQKRYSEAYEVLTKVAKVNGQPVPKDLMIQIQKVGAKQEESKKTEQKDSTYDLIRIPELRKQLLILIVLFVANVVAYAGLALNSLNFHGNELMNFFLLALADMPALFLGWYLIEGRLGRRWTNTLSLMICGFSLCIPVLLDPSQKTLITILSLLGKGGTAASYMIIFQQSAEIFPTTLRSEGMGICSTISSGVAIVVPHISYLGRYGLWIPMFIMGFGCLIAGIASSFLPETLNENLPQNSAESKKFGKNKSYFCLANVSLKTHL